MSVFGADLAPPSEDHEWRWAGPALGRSGTVGSLVPRRFDHHVRIACDVDLSDGHDASRSGGPGLPREVVDALVPRLAAETRTPGRAYMTIWEGHRWDEVEVIASKAAPRYPWSRTEPVDDPLAPAKETLAAELTTLPTLAGPDRRYVVLSGPVEAVREMHEPIAVWSRLVPDLWWPADRAWFIGSDATIAWAYLGGSAELVQFVLDSWPGRSRLVRPDEPIS